MNQLLRSLGAVLVLLGVLVLFIYWATDAIANEWLVAAALLFVCGLVAHVFFNKRFLD
ncbi:MAG: hypothetical protein MJZ19_04230 [Paludibacteraceae bacterium]|nr:hypothetical protein [Paludibacteraceae bacterium]